MRWFVIAIGLAAIPASGFARDRALETSLYASVTARNGLTLQLNLTNHTGQNLCFFLSEEDVVLTFKNGTQSQLLSIPDHGVQKPWPEKTEIVWNDRDIHAFRIEYPRNTFDPSNDAQMPVKATYRLKVFDCVTLFSQPYDTVRAIYHRDVDAKPDVIK